MDRLIEAIDWDALAGWTRNHGWRVALILGMALMTILIINHVGPRIIRALASDHPEDGDPDLEVRLLAIAAALSHTTDIVVGVVALMMVLSEIGVDVTPVVTGLGLSSLAFGLAAQGFVKDYLRGIIILGEHQYAVGDRVTLSGVTGIVQGITLRRTVLRAEDGTLHSVSHGDVTIASRHPAPPDDVSLQLTVDYGADPAAVPLLATSVLREFTTAPVWVGAVEGEGEVGSFELFDDIGATLTLRLKVRPEARWVVIGELRRRLRIAFTAAGIALPRAGRMDGPGPEDGGPAY